MWDFILFPGYFSWVYSSCYVIFPTLYYSLYCRNLLHFDFSFGSIRKKIICSNKLLGNVPFRVFLRWQLFHINWHGSYLNRYNQLYLCIILQSCRITCNNMVDYKCLHAKSCLYCVFLKKQWIKWRCGGPVAMTLHRKNII